MSVGPIVDTQIAAAVMQLAGAAVPHHTYISSPLAQDTASGRLLANEGNKSNSNTASITSVVSTPASTAASAAEVNCGTGLSGLAATTGAASGFSGQLRLQPKVQQGLSVIAGMRPGRSSVSQLLRELGWPLTGLWMGADFGLRYGSAPDGR